jgi:hypothetical protein
MQLLLSRHSTADYSPCHGGIYVHQWIFIFEYISGIAGIEGGVYVTPHRSTYDWYILASAWEIRIHFRDCGVYSNFLVSNPRVAFGWEDNWFALKDTLDCEPVLRRCIEVLGEVRSKGGKGGRKAAAVRTRNDTRTSWGDWRTWVSRSEEI